MQVPVYNAQGKQIGYYASETGYVYVYPGMKSNSGYYFSDMRPVPNYTVSNYSSTPKSSAGMPSNAQRGSSQNITKQATTPTGMPTSAKQAQAAQQNKEAVSKAHSDANYNAAVNAKEAQKKQQAQAARAAANQKRPATSMQNAVATAEAAKQKYGNAEAEKSTGGFLSNAAKEIAKQTQAAKSSTANNNNKGFLASANERIAQMTDVANTLASKPQAHQDYGYNATMYAEEARNAAKNGDIGKAAKNAAYAATNLTAAQKESSRGVPTKEEREQQAQQAVQQVPAPSKASAGNASATGKPVANTNDTQPTAQKATQQKQNGYNLDQYDKWASANLKKTLAKAGKLDQYQNFVNDFYGSSSMDSNRYDELMNKYGLGDTLKNNFYFGKANYRDSYDYANNKVKKQANKQRASNNDNINKQEIISNAVKASSKY